MNNYHIVSLTAIELKKLCNPITSIALCLQLWRHFLSIYRKRAQDFSNIRADNILKFCLELVTHNLLQMGKLTDERTTSVIDMTLYKVSIISHNDHPVDKRTIISFCDLSLKVIGNLRPCILVDFLMNLVNECAIMLKEDPKGPTFNQYVNYYSDSIYDITGMLKRTLYQIVPISDVFNKEEYISGFATLEIKQVPNSTSDIIRICPTVE